MITKNFLALMVGAFLFTGLSGCLAESDKSSDTKVTIEWSGKAGDTSHLPGKKIGGIHYFPACLPVGTFCVRKTIPEDYTVDRFLGNGSLETFYERSKLPENSGITLDTIIPKGQYMAGV
ncbi:MAG: hypothetical protein ABW116_01505 [Candidatus Sedimenticola sp. 20ELBAFRAG]